MHIIFLLYVLDIPLFVFSERYVVRPDVLTMWMLVFNYYGVLYDVILFCKASLYICSIVFCPCAVSNTIDYDVFNLPWQSSMVAWHTLQRSISGFGAGVMGGRHTIHHRNPTYQISQSPTERLNTRL